MNKKPYLIKKKTKKDPKKPPGLNTQKPILFLAGFFSSFLVIVNGGR